ncbi:hypothetical protein [Streptomyces sp. cg35]|uniref:hypothetical protein n=1 Tax=Streptomyces sp. cg35 TaxID=3421650 RepID=UPI003D16D3AA
MTVTARRIGVLMAITAAALAALAMTQNSDAGTVKRADSVWMTPVDSQPANEPNQEAVPASEPDQPGTVQPQDSVW